jgi:macrolide transport system ATP-binding/permease protein
MSIERAVVAVYRRLIRAFPEEFRLAHGSELADTAEAVVLDTLRRQGRLRLVLQLPRLFVDLGVRVTLERFEDAGRDARYAVKLLGRSPGFTAAAVICLALGTGLATAVYTQVQSTVLADLPGEPRDPAALVRVHRSVSYPEYEALRDGGGSVARVAGYVGPVPLSVSRRDGSQRRRVWGQLATPDYFDVVGIRPAVGRLFGPEERGEGATGVVIGERLWRDAFDEAPTIVGESIRINGRLVMVAGVAARGFVGASPMVAGADVWIPTTAAPRVAPELAVRSDRRSRSVQLVGRLAPAVSTAQAEAVFRTLVSGVDPALGPHSAADDLNIRLLPGGRMLAVRNEDLPRAIGFPIVLVLLVLVMACGNVANMVLARAASRQRELALRVALGASRGRVARQLVTESLILSLVGSVGGGLVAAWLLSLFERMRPLVPEYVQYDVRFHWGAFAATALVASVSTLCFSLAPAVRASRRDLQTGLKPSAPSGLRSFRHFGWRNLVVFQQVALSVVLLLLTGFVVIGWTRSARVDLGFRAAGLYFLNIDPVRDGRSAAEAAAIVSTLRDRLRSTPGIESVSVAQTIPLAMSGGEMAMNVKTDLAAGTQSLGAMSVDRVGAGFFDTVGVPFVRGRDFLEQEHANESRVVVVNETMARTAWPGADPLGERVTLDAAHTWEVVGVVRDMRSAFPLAPTLPAVFQPVTPTGYALPAKNGVTLAVRVAPGIDAARDLRGAVQSLDDDLTVVDVRPLIQEAEQALFLARVATVVYGGMGVFGLILAAVGLGGVTAYAVARRTREIGIRMALGAQRGDVLRLVLREGAGITFAGTITGAVLALLLLRALGGVVEALAEITHTTISDPLLLVGGPGLLLVLAMVACYVPARRSMTVDPVAALRAE